MTFLKVLTSIKINKDAKNSKVLHSTLAKTPSMFSLSAKISKSVAPKNAVHPRERFSSGIECKKKTQITKSRAKLDL